VRAYDRRRGAGAKRAHPSTERGVGWVQADERIGIHRSVGAHERPSAAVVMTERVPGGEPWRGAVDAAAARAARRRACRAGLLTSRGVTEAKLACAADSPADADQLVRAQHSK